jgi:tetratricopeptide (TPR) repeat protein
LRRIVLIGLLGSGAANADLTGDLADLSARAEYGFYTAEPTLIDAARRDLERLDAKDARVSYYRGLAAMRAAQVETSRGRPAGRALGACIESAEQAAEQEPTSAEAWVLVAACSTLAADGRRFDAAAANARRLERENPRLALVEAWHAFPDGGGLEDPTDALVGMLEAAVMAFEVASSDSSTLGWGEAEALASLGALYLERGMTRAARDVLERALLAAPGYVDAVELMARIGGSRSARP